MTTLRPKRVLITRAQADAAPLAAAVRAMGAEAICQPAVRMVPADADADAATQAALAAWPKIAAIACASRYGAQALARWLAAHTLALPPHAQLHAVGPATAAVMQALFNPPIRVALPHTAEGLGAQLVAQVPPHRTVLLPTAVGAGVPLAKALQAGGLAPLRLPLYATECIDMAPGGMTIAPTVDYIVFTSPSCVRGFLRQGGSPHHAPVLTLGPTTTAAARRAGFTVAAEASPASLSALIALLETRLCPTPGL